MRGRISLLFLGENKANPVVNTWCNKFGVCERNGNIFRSFNSNDFYSME